MRIFVSLFLILTFSSIFSQCPDGNVADSVNLIKNGDFTFGNRHFECSYHYSSDLYPESTYSVTNNPVYVHDSFSSCTDRSTTSGKMMVVNGASKANTIVWSQTINVTPQTTYMFSTWICSVCKGNPAILQFSINGVLLGKPFEAPKVTCHWKQFFTNWNSQNNSIATISIVNQNTKHDGNDFAIDDISFYQCLSQDLKLDLDNAKYGQTIKLQNVIFESGKSNLKPESFKQLNILTQYLKNNPSIIIKISGHTDNIGSKESNLILSQKRSDMVKSYLIKNDVSPDRIKSVGFGDSKPVDSNTTFEGRQKNRRVEFKILAIN